MPIRYPRTVTHLSINLDPLIALCDEADFAVVEVDSWCGDGRYDGICAGVSIISWSFAVRICMSVTGVLCAPTHVRFVTLSILLRSRVFQSRIFHPLLGGLTFSSPRVLVPSFPLFPVPRFQRLPYGGAENARRENDGREIEGPICRAWNSRTWESTIWN